MCINDFQGPKLILFSKFNIVGLSEKLTTSWVLSYILDYHSLVSLFLKFLIGLGYRGSTRAQFPTVYHPIRLSFRLVKI